MRRFTTGMMVAVLSGSLFAGVAVAQTGGQGGRGGEAESGSRARTSKPTRMTITEACETDSAIYCDDDERRGVSKVACLRRNKSLVSPDCAAVIGGR